MNNNNNTTTGASKRFAAGIVGASVTLASLGLGGVEAADAAGYPYPNAPDCNEYGPDGCVADRWNFYQGQCTSYVAWRLNAVNGIAFHNYYRSVHWGNAANWDDAARAAGFRVDTTPGLGAVGHWNDRNHVAYVERVNSDGSIVLSDQNSDLHNGIRSSFTVRRGDSWWPERFIHIKDLANTSAATSTFSVGKTRLVDDPTITGPSSWLVRRSNTSHGYNRDYTITQSGAGRAVTNTGVWTFRDVPRGATVRVQAYVPTREAIARVVYQGFDGNRKDVSKPINQQATYGWVTLFYVKVDNGTLTVKLPDNLGGAGQYGRMIGFDAVRITRTR